MDKPNRLKRHFSILFFGLFFIDGGRHLGHNYFNFLFFFFFCKGTMEDFLFFVQSKMEGKRHSHSPQHFEEGKKNKNKRRDPQIWDVVIVLRQAFSLHLFCAHLLINSRSIGKPSPRFSSVGLVVVVVPASNLLHKWYVIVE